MLHHSATKYYKYCIIWQVDYYVIAKNFSSNHIEDTNLFTHTQFTVKDCGTALPYIVKCKENVVTHYAGKKYLSNLEEWIKGYKHLWKNHGDIVLILILASQ